MSLERIISFCLLFVLSSCVSPPKNLTSSVIPDREISVISLMNQGKEYALASRLGLAEEKFRKAIMLSPELDHAYNDLGFVLLAQGQSKEAIVMFRRALEYVPSNFIARQNLARAYYLESHYKPAIREYKRVLEWYHSTDNKNIYRDDLSEYRKLDLSKIHRALATIYYVTGELGNAVCHSATALTLKRNDEQTVKHERMLLSLGRSQDVYDILHPVVVGFAGKVSPEIMLDYGISLYSLGEEERALRAMSKVIKSSGVEFSDKITARLIKILLYQKGENLEEVSSQSEDLIAEHKELCKEDIVDPNNYWPALLVDNISGLKKELCSSEQV